MCDMVTALTSIGGMIFSKMMAPDAPKAPKVSAPRPVEQTQPGQQSAKAPDVDTLRAQNAARAKGSGYTTNQSTLLTGPAGEDESALNLGKSTLLGE